LLGSTCTVSNQSLAELTDGNLNQCGVMALAFTNRSSSTSTRIASTDPPG
jgi:hypothetical protein